MLLERGQNEDNGYKYFTCSTSSLERVFMEIVRISEQEEEQSEFEEHYQDSESNDSLPDFSV